MFPLLSQTQMNNSSAHCSSGCTATQLGHQPQTWLPLRIDQQRHLAHQKQFRSLLVAIAQTWRNLQTMDLWYKNVRELATAGEKHTKQNAHAPPRKDELTDTFFATWWLFVTYTNTTGQPNKLPATTSQICL